MGIARGKRTRPTRRMIRAMVRWQGLVADHRASGKGLDEFCRERHISKPMFYKWRKRLRPKWADLPAAPRALPAPAAAPRAPETTAPASAPLAVPAARLVPVRLTGQLGPAGAGWAIEVQFPAGHVLRVARGVDPETVATVLATMRVVAC